MYRNEAAKEKVYTSGGFAPTFTNALQLINQGVERGIFRLDEDEPATIIFNVNPEDEQRIDHELDAGRDYSANIYDLANWLTKFDAVLKVYIERFYKLGYPIVLKDNWWENDKIGWENGVYIGAEPDPDIYDY